MKKVVLILGCNLVIFGLALAFTEHSFSLKLESYLENVEEGSKYEIETALENKDYFYDLNLADDGAEAKHLNINILSQKYDKDLIDINDSDFKISEELETEILDAIANYGGRTSFYIVSLKDGVSIGYNVDDSYDAASSIKAPYAYYIYRLIDEGKIDRNMEIEYLPQHYNAGTGIVKNSEFGTKFTVEELVHYSIHDSDNVAHIMLHATFGIGGYNAMLKDVGTEFLYMTKSIPWSFTSCRSAALMWQEIYNFSISSPNGLMFFNEVADTKFSYFREAGIEEHIVNKAGWASKSIIESGIVFGDMPYIAVAMTTSNGNNYAEVQVTKLVGYMHEIMKEYQAYKNSNSI